MNVHRPHYHNGDWIKILVPILSAVTLSLGGVRIAEEIDPSIAPTTSQAIEACRSVNELRHQMREIILLAQIQSDNPDSPFFDRAFERLQDAQCTRI